MSDLSPTIKDRTGLVATALLIIVLTLFFISDAFESQYPWLAWVKSFSEAASVGAIADWFAVTALFRHPLGLPIPHTAIIARQRDRIARGLGDFIDRNFLSGEVLRKKIIDQNISLTLVTWASEREHSSGIGSILKKLTVRSLHLFEDKAFLTVLTRDMTSALKEIPLSPFCGRLLKFVIESDTEQEVFAGAIIQVKNLLTNHRQAIEHFISSKLPWYIPEFLGRPAFREFLHKLNQQIIEIEHDKSHPARQQFRDYLLGFAAELETSDVMGERGEKIKSIIATSPALAQYLSLLTSKIFIELKSQMAQDDSALSRLLENAASSFIGQLREDRELQAALNSWLFDVLGNLSNHPSVNFSALVQEVFASWDTRTLVRRVEEQVSSDLQYIRINGTLIGGLAGVALHAIAGLQW